MDIAGVFLGVRAAPSVQRVRRDRQSGASSALEQRVIPALDCWLARTTQDLAGPIPVVWSLSDRPELPGDDAVLFISPFSVEALVASRVQAVR